MLRDPFRKGLRDLRRSFPFWAVGIVVWPLWLAAVYPSLRKSAADVQSYVESWPDALKNMFMGQASFSTPIGFVDAELMSLMSPIFFLVFAIGLAARQIAGEEEDGTLSLLLAHPVSRTRLLAEKAVVVVVGLLGLLAVQIVAMLAGIGIGDMGTGPMHLDLGVVLTGHLYLGLFTLAVAAITYAVGAATGRRGVAIGAGVAAGAGSYLLNALAPLTDTTEPLRKASLFYYAGGTEPLATDLDAGYLAVLVGVSLVATAIAFVTFRRRDVRV